MDYFGINSSEDLPKISEVLMEELVQATHVKEAEDNATAEITELSETVLAVTETGEIVEEVTGENNTNEQAEG